MGLFPWSTVLFFVNCTGYNNAVLNLYPSGHIGNIEKHEPCQQNSWRSWKPPQLAGLCLPQRGSAEDISPARQDFIDPVLWQKFPGNFVLSGRSLDHPGRKAGGYCAQGEAEGGASGRRTGGDSGAGAVDIFDDPFPGESLAPGFRGGLRPEARGLQNLRYLAG